VERRLAQCRGGLERHVRVIHVIASPSGGGDFITAPGVYRFREGRGLELTIGGSPRPRGSAGDPFSNSAQRPTRFQGAKGPTLPRRPRRPEEHEPSPRHLFNDSDHPDRDSLKRRPSRARLTTPALTPNVPQGGGFGCHPTAPPIFDHLGWQSPERTCFPPCRRGPRAGLRCGRGRKDSPRDAEGAQLLTVKIRQPSHEFTFGVGISFIPYPLVLTPVV
jgi:hypothetical protein